ncbi:MAG: uroporphyrinogen decarboxylase family protein [Candidatus Zipacnadales bacterium]
MTSRERILKALHHQEPDRVPIDLGSTAVTGIAASTLSKLRVALGLDQPGDRVKVVEPYQMLGEVTDDLRDALGIDTVGLTGLTTLFGFENRDWKPWELFDGTPVLVPGSFNTELNPDGSLYMYPQGDKHAPPSGKMPAGGYYFDSLIRQEPIDERHLDPQDNLQEFQPISDRELEHFTSEAKRLYEDTKRAIVANFGGTGFGDIALVPAPWLKRPKGIRDVEEWYISTVIRREYVLKVFEGQCEIALANLQRISKGVGNRVAVVMLTGTDFGTQRGPFISLQTYRELYKPFHKALNDWVHQHTAWKTFIHTCGGVEPLINDFIDAGFDIMNPVQCSAEGMDPVHLKRTYGDRLVFWGAGVDTQRTLPFGTPEEVRREVRERVEILAPGGGFVFNPIHNIQPNTPIQNLEAMFAALQE